MSLLDHLGIQPQTPDHSYCRKGDPRNHGRTRPVRDLWTAAVYIERDGAKRAYASGGLTVFHGPASGGCYSFTVADDDLPQLDAARDRARAKFAR